jgi:hypothetical protein
MLITQIERKNGMKYLGKWIAKKEENG